MKSFEDEFSVKESGVGLEIHGPFQTTRLSIDGYKVPLLEATLVDSIVHLTLDNRFGIEIPVEYSTPVVWLIANAMAIGAGYTCFGEHSEVANQFKTKLAELKAEIPNANIVH